MFLCSDKKIKMINASARALLRAAEKIAWLQANNILIKFESQKVNL